MAISLYLIEEESGVSIYVNVYNVSVYYYRVFFAYFVFFTNVVADTARNKYFFNKRSF